MNRHSKHTMQRIGSTEEMLSCTLPAIMVFCLLNSFILPALPMDYIHYSIVRLKKIVPGL